MESGVTFIGFGEAAIAFAGVGARGFDVKLDDPAARPAKHADFERAGVRACDSAAQALAGAGVDTVAGHRRPGACCRARERARCCAQARCGST